MAELKVGGNDVKIMYGDREIGGTTELEPGTILYIANYGSENFENAHLLSTTKNWSNIDGIKIAEAGDRFDSAIYEANISGDDFKNLDINKKYSLGSDTVTVSRSTVDGEYRLNVSGYRSSYTLVVSAI